jgi:hypothetical protein
MSYMLLLSIECFLGASKSMFFRLLQGGFGFQCNHARSTLFIRSCNGRCLDLARARTDDVPTEKGTKILFGSLRSPTLHSQAPTEVAHLKTTKKSLDLFQGHLTFRTLIFKLPI